MSAPARSFPGFARRSLCRQCRKYTTQSSSPKRTISASTRTTTISSISSPQQSFQLHRVFSQTRMVNQISESSATSPSAPSSVPQTHYDLFPQTLPHGPPPSSPFPINTRLLRREFLSLQAKYHPDLHPPSSKARAEATSSLINEAYKTLSNPLLRAQYLLSLRGINVADDETLKVEEPELLMLVLEAREEIEEAEGEENLEEPGLRNEERIRGSEEVLERAFSEDNMDLAMSEAVRLRYWINIKESIDNWEKGKPIVLHH